MSTPESTPARNEPRIALVTGAAGGIGAAVARRLSKDGVKVILADLRADRLAPLVAESAGPFAALEVDLTDRASLPDFVDRARQVFGGLDILVNAAGLYPSAPILEMRDDQWDQVMDVNLSAVFSLSRAFARSLVDAGHGGHIVNISSGASARARRGAAHYCTSKAGLDMLTKAFALELAEHSIHVNAVSPGFIEVDSEVNPLGEEYVRKIRGGQPWPRAGVPEDIAGAVSFLCGPDAAWMTGASLSVDGGAGTGNAALPLS
ncbi:SDR family NAD(P)-dependent oxidoreductase [Streptomyces sp. NBC_00102]|uniref:SDR family NAD(P)-dependent oxidoreductase n=1 Tax=Streptomyces sp. NBC_00102 TaxID=2975652 RepID=UPI0022511E28|nr:SDR family oxidoreductase [Streptomyces sp. NBC_00102]MCX5397746.1 SDR family oxidoreductase [Streptomyces sp. NBC_00102]